MLRTTLALIVLGFSSCAAAEHLLEEYYRRVEVAGLTGKEAEKTIEALLTRAETRSGQEAGSADAWLAVGVVRAAYAKAKGGVSGLTQLKRARVELETSIELDPEWLDGYARAFLARLYMSLPPWPISFGNDKHAKNLLQDVIKTSPSSFAGNLYEGMRLAEDKQYVQAEKHFIIVSNAAIGCECPHWTAFLRGQAKTLSRSGP